MLKKKNNKGLTTTKEYTPIPIKNPVNAALANYYAAMAGQNVDSMYSDMMFDEGYYDMNNDPLRLRTIRDRLKKLITTYNTSQYELTPYTDYLYGKGRSYSRTIPYTYDSIGNKDYGYTNRPDDKMVYSIYSNFGLDPKYYNDIGNYINVNDPGAFLAEMAHTYQDRNGVPASMWKLNREYGDSEKYNTPGTLEYDAHRKVEPALNYWVGHGGDLDETVKRFRADKYSNLFNELVRKGFSRILYSNDTGKLYTTLPEVVVTPNGNYGVTDDGYYHYTSPNGDYHYRKLDKNGRDLYIYNHYYSNRDPFSALFYPQPYHHYYDYHNYNIKPRRESR